MEALTETDSDIKIRLKSCSIWEWIIRIFNQFILFSLWFLLQWSLFAFAIGLTVLYVLFIVWDIITNERTKNRQLFITDIIGLIFTLVFLIISYFAMKGDASLVQKQFISQSPELMLPTNNATSIRFYWGICVLLYIAIPIIGLIITKGKLFKKRYWIRENLV